MRLVYNVIEAKNLLTLIDKVNIAMNDGWQSKGGISCVTLSRPDGLSNFRFMQAVTKNINNPNEESEQ